MAAMAQLQLGPETSLILALFPPAVNQTMACFCPSVACAPSAKWSSSFSFANPAAVHFCLFVMVAQIAKWAFVASPLVDPPILTRGLFSLLVLTCSSPTSNPPVKTRFSRIHQTVWPCSPNIGTRSLCSSLVFISLLNPLFLCPLYSSFLFSRFNPLSLFNLLNPLSPFK